MANQNQKPVQIGTTHFTQSWQWPLVFTLVITLGLAVAPTSYSAPQTLTKEEKTQEKEKSEQKDQKKEKEGEETKTNQDNKKKEDESAKGKSDQEKEKKSERDLLFDQRKAQKKKKAAEPRKPVPIDFSVKGTKELTFDNMIFNIKPDESFKIKQLTHDLIKLRKHKIRIRGYILPGFKQNNIQKFILVRDNQDCCFGPGAALYDCMIVTLAKGETTSFSVRPITVEGTFFLKPFRGIGNKVEAILQLKDAKVKK